ncbi:MAG: CaiB/BaiF CoA transferase family protein [Acidimicrobiales bacterium]
MLDGITVLDLASVGPGARASRWLADYGATVVKVGPVPGREGVQIVPPPHAYSAHRGLKRVLLDLKSPAGVDVFLRLADGADVIIESFRPGVVDRLGIGYEAVRARQPGIVYCSTTGYGQTGPHAAWAGHDLNYLAVSGFLAGCGRQGDGRPPIPGATVADSAGGGMQAVMAILAALVRRSVHGAGTWLDVSVADGMLALMALHVDEFLADGCIPSNVLTGRYACYGIYGTSDAKWLSVAAIEPRFWTNLCRALGVERWAEHQFDDGVQDDIRADLERSLGARTRDEWVAVLAPADTCVAPVLDVDEVVTDAQYLARGAVVDNGPVRQVGAVLAGMGPLAPIGDPATTDTSAVLAAVGMSADEIETLRDKGVIA